MEEVTWKTFPGTDATGDSLWFLQERGRGLPNQHITTRTLKIQPSVSPGRRRAAAARARSLRSQPLRWKDCHLD